MSLKCIMILELGQTERSVWVCVCMRVCVFLLYKTKSVAAWERLIISRHKTLVVVKKKFTILILIVILLVYMLISSNVPPDR